ncbi:DUF6268 family outer membrane beta-barrel protein [Bythopirellula polymerisocia]|uniref:Uncharacterized protein n=1 Tax=Bythopirellula polymerisocia TaxID=2528003 RepID=A0A5C6CBM6_9BACT|nr:DUF6268 family outer membrane beta-barrel protein [Bythopirellula polymerisocia]TWU21237.1 hypothetical protein Pla144_46460 [Bythopirellula polymerisocia]
MALLNQRSATIHLVILAHAPILCVATLVTAVQGQTQRAWGGTLIAERIPHQPEQLLDHWVDDSTPLDLETILLKDEQVRLAGLASETTAIASDLEMIDSDEAQLPPGTRNGVFQKLLFTGTYLPQLEADSLGWGDLEAGVVFGFPFLRRDTPLLITPRFGVHYLDGAANFDLPDTLYDASIEFRHLRKFGDGPWAMDAAVTLGHYSDYEDDDADAFRVTGRGLVVYESSPTTKWLAGVAYLNRAGATVLPIGGVIYEPTPDVSYELIFPRPRFWWLLPGSNRQIGDERWVFLGGEFGGGVWSIERPSTQEQDLLTYLDYRVLVGYQRNLPSGISCTFEFGYVFGRQLEFSGPSPDVSLDDTMFTRVGLKF